MNQSPLTPRIIFRRLHLALWLSLPFTASALFAQPFLTSGSLTATWHDNLTQAVAGVEHLAATQFAASLAAEHCHTLNRDDALLLGAAINAEAWSRYTGLDRATLGGQLGWRHRFGLGAYAPTLRLDLATAVVVARESARTGNQSTATLRASRRFSPETRLDLAADYGRQTARDTVLGQQRGSLSAEVAYDPNPQWRWRGRVRWANGDVLVYHPVTWTPWGWQHLHGYGAGYNYYAFPTSIVRTFGPPHHAHRVFAHTWSYSLGVSPAIGPRTALTFQIERAETAYDAISYINHALTLGVAHQF